MRKALMIAAIISLAAPAVAQEKQAGKPVMVRLVKFKPGTIDRIDEIERKYFDPAAEKLGIRPIIIHMISGSWDRQYIFPMSGGMASLDYKENKADIAWRAELDQRAGGHAAAQKLLEEWGQAVANESSEFGFSD